MIYKRPGYVYVLWTEAAFYKIGFSENPWNRLAALRGICNKYGFGCCAYTSWFETPYAGEWESFLHKYFKPKQLDTNAGREWYLLDTDDIDFFWSMPDSIPVHPYVPDYWRLLKAPEEMIEYVQEYHDMLIESKWTLPEPMSTADMYLSIINANSGRPGDKD